MSSSPKVVTTLSNSEKNGVEVTITVPPKTREELIEEPNWSLTLGKGAYKDAEAKGLK